MTDLRKAAEAVLEAWGWDWSEPRNEALRERMEALRQALAQPEQEPVAWVDITDEGKWSVRFAVPVLSLPDGTKFYTAPPKREWVGLTMQEYVEIENNVAAHYAPNNVPRSVRVFAQVLWETIEAKLKKKNT